MKRDSQADTQDGRPSIKGLGGSGPTDWKKQTDGQKVASLGLHFPKRERDGA